MLPAQLEQFSLAHARLKGEQHDRVSPEVVRIVCVSAVSAALVVFERTQQVDLFLRSQASGSLIVVARAADHAHQVVGQVNALFAASYFQRALK